ncbi:uncharacterized protein K02A2.6-like [Uranotaenia lowii]|uniref:uncharacterized protein K02A2.6-like n=1 Tax=Uranotaenia lowii TaxID=190385 RepID=UPI00247B016F|nr:uncharacterized protein K02A2.6-like [Uranotaenia lowii]
MPVVDELLARIGTGKVRSKLDIRDAFLQTELAPESRDITTFITSRGLFRFKRLPFGLVSAPEIFQKVMDEILSGCEGTVCYLDDIYVEGKDVEEHDIRLKIVFDRLTKRGVVLNMQKCIIRVSELQFLGHVISPNGIRPSPSKVEALLSFRQPENVSEIKSFLGLANYLNKFIPNLAAVDEPLRRLLHQTAKFSWGQEQQHAFDVIKQALTKDNNLGYYNCKDVTSVIADAGPTALGAALIQTNNQGEHRVICFASKSLTETERRYCQTEKEALALVWSVERFQMYLLGKSFDLITDCKALLYLFNPRSKPCARIERWVLRLQGFQYNVKHIPGHKNIVDALSRLSTLKPVPFDVAEELFVNGVGQAAASTAAIRWEEVDRTSEQDEEIMQIFESISSGRLFELPMEYRGVGRELCRVGNVLMRGDRVVVPKRLREQVLSLAHEGHPGTRMMKSHLRSSVWWPKLDSDVEAYVKQCRGCLLTSAPDAPEPMRRRDLPSAPWEDIAIDFLGPLPEGQFLLVVVDYYSRYYEVCEMATITAEDTIKELVTIFSRHGIPVTLTADNAPQLSEDCELFSKFCKDFGILLINTIPYWPQMNGEVERQNRTILKRLQFAQELGQDWRRELQKFLLTYRAASHSTTGRSPAELLFGRKIRTKLPLMVSSRDDEELRDRDAMVKQKGKEYSDKHRNAQESEVSVGDRVLMKRFKKDNKLSTPFSNEEYVVLTKTGSDTTVKSTVSGKEYRRNTSHLKKIPKRMDKEAHDDGTTERTSMMRTSAETDDPGAADHVNTNAEHERKRMRKEPAWFQTYVPH